MLTKDEKKGVDRKLSSQEQAKRKNEPIELVGSEDNQYAGLRLLFSVPSEV